MKLSEIYTEIVGYRNDHGFDEWKDVLPEVTQLETENETLKADKRLLMHVVHGRAMASSLPKHLKEEACP